MIVSSQGEKYSSNREGDDNVHGLPFYGISGDIQSLYLPWSAWEVALKELWAVTSIHHLCMKFSTKNGIATIKGIKVLVGTA